MMLKSFFALALTVSAFAAIAQDTDERTEIPAECLTAPITLSVDAPKSFAFGITFECQVFNYKLTVYNAEGEEVFQSTNPTETWDSNSVPAGTYTWKLLGTMGNTIDYYHVKKRGEVSVVK